MEKPPISSIESNSRPRAYIAPNVTDVSVRHLNVLCISEQGILSHTTEMEDSYILE